ncbi:hypothetical protein [Shouchella patagoniensis]|uniref:hypothetical protein n=1 Tax=Shouchella patagoniensis TaxID=228576 RepID=UPI000994E559|nr:hypothetical protein [Shouchella patagoniensis]
MARNEEDKCQSVQNNSNQVKTLIYKKLIVINEMHHFLPEDKGVSFEHILDCLEENDVISGNEIKNIVSELVLESEEEKIK